MWLALAVLAGWVATSTLEAYEPLYAFTNFVGTPGGPGITDGPASAARYYWPGGMAADSAGTLYLADSWNHTIRRITADGWVSTLAGHPGIAGTNDGAGAEAQFHCPTGVALDGTGNVYVADCWSHTIRMITPAGIVTTLAGLPGIAGTNDGVGTAAHFHEPRGIAVDSTGTIYVTDSENCTIRQISAGGVVTTLAGHAEDPGSEDGNGDKARFGWPDGIVASVTGNLYVADWGNCTIRQVTPEGVVTTLAGSADRLGSNDGTGTAAQFWCPAGVALDSLGNLYVADCFNHTIRKMTPTRKVITLAGLAGRNGSHDGIGSAARFHKPHGVAVDPSGNIYVADQFNNLIRRITSAGVVTTLSGQTSNYGTNDGVGAVARFQLPAGVTVDSVGNAYVMDGDNHTIRKVTPAGKVTTLAGQGGIYGSEDGTAGASRFLWPYAAVVDSSDNLYVTDWGNDTIRKVTPAGVVTTFAGQPRNAGTNDGARSAARFNCPAGIARHSDGTLYVADSKNHSIRKITSAGIVTTLAGRAGSPGNEDGSGGAARFNWPRGIGLDSAGNLYVADLENHTIRKVTPAGAVTTLAGQAGCYGTNDGVGTAARFHWPQGVAVDRADNLWVADSGNNILRKITPGGAVTTVGGTAGRIGTLDGVGASAQFASPYDVAFDAAGNLYVADCANHRVTKGVPVCRFAPLIAPGPSGLDLRLSGSIGMVFDLQASPDLTNWFWLARLTNTTGQAVYRDPLSTQTPARFYRALEILQP